jgi:hypothetical protein
MAYPLRFKDEALHVGDTLYKEGEALYTFQGPDLTSQRTNPNAGRSRTFRYDGDPDDDKFDFILTQTARYATPVSMVRIKRRSVEELEYQGYELRRKRGGKHRKSVTMRRRRNSRKNTRK